jgi:hypothetical protein
MAQKSEAMLTSAQAREIIAIEQGIPDTELIDLTWRRYCVWGNLQEKGLVKFSKDFKPHLTSKGQGEWHRVFMRRQKQEGPK